MPAISVESPVQPSTQKRHFTEVEQEQHDQSNLPRDELFTGRRVKRRIENKSTTDTTQPIMKALANAIPETANAMSETANAMPETANAVAETAIQQPAEIDALQVRSPSKPNSSIVMEAERQHTSKAQVTISTPTEAENQHTTKIQVAQHEHDIAMIPSKKRHFVVEDDDEEHSTVKDTERRVKRRIEQKFDTNNTQPIMKASANAVAETANQQPVEMNASQVRSPPKPNSSTAIEAERQHTTSIQAAHHGNDIAMTSSKKRHLVVEDDDDEEHKTVKDTERRVKRRIEKKFNTDITQPFMKASENAIAETAASTIAHQKPKPTGRSTATQKATEIQHAQILHLKQEHEQTSTGSTSTTNSSSDEERITKVIEYLENEFPVFQNDYKIIDKIGEGSFSMVFLAEDLRYEEYTNDDWKSAVESMEQSNHNPTITSVESSASATESITESTSTSTPLNTDKEMEGKPITEDGKHYVAIKCIYEISSPERILNELQILKKLKGKPGITSLITSFREKGNVFFVMPHHKADSFTQFFCNVSMTEVRFYMKALFYALKTLRHNNIIHRDLKPNNFLYDSEKKRGYLIDFGLAEVVLKDQPRIRLSRAGAALIEWVKKQLNEQTEIGYFSDDPRPIFKANRAGTRGFRAPETLLRTKHQTCAIDVWSAGVILASILTGKYPFFIAGEESDALIEIAQVYGKTAMDEMAAKYGRTFDTNVILPTDRKSWGQICQLLNGDQIAEWGDDVTTAIDFLEKCLDLDADKRITADEALEHPFLKDVQ
ncbi:kinase-like domain-containing protein [Mycotypha africana]|uniref:kinase-like domain-containing protein n=1 Tax=Mycotypha africana TaxID=64632 RepID=UPI0023012273|nr:kinase-like domain-containing protein [Mycotypha africana]KAI8970058.1 kinase-like domain-containing protein [Mycotypha africana]